ncbi:MAG: extracellular solute-binding protein [Rhodospirillales bacterium]
MTMLRRSVLQSSFAAMASGSALAQGSDMAAITAAALKHGKLNLLHNIPPPLGDLWIAEFAKVFPKIALEATRLGSTEMMQRFGTEYQAGVTEADLLITLWDETLIKWSDQGWLRTWTPPEAAGIPTHFKTRDQLYISHFNRSCLVSSKTKIKEADAPKEWTDFFDPKWQGKIGMDPPWRSVAVQQMLAVWEQQGIKDVAKRLKANGVRFFNGSAGVVQAVIRGDITVAAVIDPPVISALNDGAPIRAIFPASGVPAVGNVLLMPAKAPHPESGQLFLNWALSLEGQKALVGTIGSPAVRPGAGAPKVVPGIEGQKIVLSSDLLTPTMQKAMIEEWRTVFGLQ